MSATQDLSPFKSRIDALRYTLDDVSEDDWQACIKVRNILLSLGVLLVDEDETPESDAVKEATPRPASY